MKQTLLTTALLLGFLMSSLISFAQQDPNLSLNNEFNSYTNPSFMVNDYKLNVAAYYRQRQLNPFLRTTLINASYRIDKAWSAFGVSVLSYNSDWWDRGSALFNYAFDGKIGEHHIVPGIQVGVVYHILDASRFEFLQENNPNFSFSRSDLDFDIGLSIAYRYRGLAVGFSANHLNSPNLEAWLGFGLAPQYNAYVSYEALLGQSFRLKNLSFLRTINKSTRYDKQLWFGIRDVGKVFDGASIGLGYRLNINGGFEPTSYIHDFIVATEIKLNWFTLGYSYELPVYSSVFVSQGQVEDGYHECYLRVHMFSKTQEFKPNTLD